MSDYDLVIAGGGLGGSALARAMAGAGYRVLVLERETQFRDRIRGEQMHPWGVAETRELGIYDLLRRNCGHELPWWDTYVGAERIMHRDVRNTTPQRACEFAYYHPAMQEVLLQAAAEAGAEVRRGAVARGVRPGERPSVVIEAGGRADEARARLIVGADGRNSMVRRWAGFSVSRDPEHLLVSGLLFDEMPAPEDTSYTVFNESLGQRVLLFPQGRRRVRAYLSIKKTVDGVCREMPTLRTSWPRLSRPGPPPTFIAMRAPPGRWPRSTGPIRGWIIPIGTAWR